MENCSVIPAEEPEKNYNSEYRLPKHWNVDPYSRRGTDYFGYVGLVVSLLPSPPCTVLDAGCGDGRVTAELTTHGYQVTGLDSSEAGIRWAKAIVPDAEFRVADLRAPSTFEDFLATFETVICVEVLEHIPPPDQQKVLNSVARTLRSGGTLVITVPSDNLQAMSPWHYNHFSLQQILQMIEEAGLVPQDQIYQRPIWAFSDILWNCVSNRLYDLPWLRKRLSHLISAHFLTTRDPEKAGRYIIRAKND